MRRQTKGGKNGRKYDKGDDSDFSGGDLDFSLQLQSQANIGKRTGRVIKEKNWRKNTEGFFNVEIQPDDSLTPQSKIAQLKQFLGLHREEQQSLENKNQFSSQENQQSQIQQQRHQPNKKKNSRRSTAFNKNSKRMTRRTEFSFSFSFDLDDNLMEASFSSQQTDFEEDYDPMQNQKQVRKSDSGKITLSNDDKQSVQQIIKKQQLQKDQKLSKLQFKEEEQYKRNKIDIQKYANKENKDKNRKQVNKQQAKQISLQYQQVKPSTYRYQFQRKSDKVHSLVVESQKIESNFQGKQSIKKDFNNISDIKANEKSIDFSIDNDLLLASFLGEIENNPSYSQTAGELNKAVINTQTENTKEDDEKENKEKQTQLNKKSKHIIEKQDKSKKTFVKNSQPELDIEKKKSFEKQQEKKNALPKSKKSKQNYFLTESLRKQAHFYYEKQKKQNQEKQNLENKIKKAGKRQLQFQGVETSDLLDEQKLEQMKYKFEQQKGSKKVKNNEPLPKTQKSEKDKDKDKGKIVRQESISQKISQKNPKKLTFERIQQRVSEQYEDDDFVPDQKQQQSKIKMNNRVVKQADKIFKRRERPQRISSGENKGLKKSETMSVQRKPNTMKLEKVSRAKTEVERLMMDNRNYSLIIDDSMMQSGRKYPKRHRFGRVQAWKGERIIYDIDGNAVQVESKQLIRLIGLINESSLDSEITIVKGDRYVQKVLLQPRQIVEFEGFDDKFRQLHITYIRKSKGNYDKVNRTVQVLQNGETTKLIQPRVIEANSGRFIIMNKSEGSAYLELILFKNEEFEI